MNSNRYSKVPEHMRAEVKRVIEKHSGRRVPLRRQTLSALKTYGHFLARMVRDSHANVPAAMVP